MNLKIIGLAVALAPAFFASAETVTLKLIETTDVHGSIFPIDLINMQPANGTLSRVHTYVTGERGRLGDDNVILLDNGDFLQGQPTVYYYNYIDTISRHPASEIMNFMGYDAATIGNHDVETGHAVYDRWIEQDTFPMLGANVIETSTGESYLPSYTVINRNGIKVAILGMITPAIPGWLPENLWSGLRFDDMIETAKRVVPEIIAEEKPDLLVGLFHSGRDSTKTTGDVIENASLKLAHEVPGFDIIFMGHDHSPYMDAITGPDGRTCLILNPANAARRVAEVEVDFDVTDGARAAIVGLRPALKSMDNVAVSDTFMNRFSQQLNEVEAFVNRPIGRLKKPLTTRDAYFGSSAFIDFIHSMQLDISGADISFAAPLSFDATIDAGEIHVSDMFNLYKYENMLYTVEMTGREIKDYLEMSYDIWTNTMSSADDRLLRLRNDATGEDMTHIGFQYPSYNFDSAAGINYVVDVTKPRGEKVTILSMADGAPFDERSTYLVAVNSYRGNGGGNLMTQGAGIAQEDLAGRIVAATDRDLRFYLMQYIERNPDLDPKPADNWRFVPTEIAAPAAVRDRKLLFGE